MEGAGVMGRSTRGHGPVCSVLQQAHYCSTATVEAARVRGS
jgi:hypothetical protein